MLKKFIKVLAVILGVLSLTFAFAGCKNPSGETSEPVTGEFYTLREAYNNGYLTRTDLESIAYYHNGEKPYPESINDDTAKSIKSAWAKKLADDETDPITDATEDKFTISKYYGTYDGCVAVIVERTGAMYPAVYSPVEVEIGNVIFKYNLYHPQIVVWKLNVSK